MEIPCNFVGVFKVGDNLVYNSWVLCDLITSNSGGRFNKLIVLQVGSILEAALGQIIYRAQHHSREGVPNISEPDRQEIKGKKVDKFNSIIDVMKKYKILDNINNTIYEDLHNLRRYRNKVHIQDDISISGVPRDEIEAFSNDICIWAIGLNVSVIGFLSEQLGRPKHLRGYVRALSVPIHGDSATVHLTRAT